MSKSSHTVPFEVPGTPGFRLCPLGVRSVPPAATVNRAGFRGAFLSALERSSLTLEFVAVAVCTLIVLHDTAVVRPWSENAGASLPEVSWIGLAVGTV